MTHGINHDHYHSLVSETDRYLRAKQLVLLAELLSKITYSSTRYDADEFPTPGISIPSLLSFRSFLEWSVAHAQQVYKSLILVPHTGNLILCGGFGKSQREITIEFQVDILCCVFEQHGFPVEIPCHEHGESEFHKYYK